MPNDSFANNSVINDISDAFNRNNTKTIYGALDYINKKGGIVRTWCSVQFSSKILEFGWMLPHPIFYYRRYLFQKFDLYNLYYWTAADHALITKWLYINKLHMAHLQKIIIRIKLSRKGNKSITARVKGMFVDLKAMRK